MSTVYAVNLAMWSTKSLARINLAMLDARVIILMLACTNFSDFATLHVGELYMESMRTTTCTCSSIPGSSTVYRSGTTE